MLPSRPNFADPDYEPTDDDLVRLSHEAFAEVRQANDAALAALRREIVARGERVLMDLEGRLATRTARP